MTNQEWIKLIVKEFHVSNSIAKKMLHGMYEARKNAIGLLGTKTSNLVIDEFLTKKESSR